jgi:hypothetical protein
MDGRRDGQRGCGPEVHSPIADESELHSPHTFKCGSGPSNRLKLEPSSFHISSLI